MNETDVDLIRTTVSLLDTRSGGQSEEAWNRLRPLGEGIVPFLLEAYPHTRLWQGRTSLVFHATRYARTSEAAFKLGVEALNDKSFMVRYRACGLLAYSLRREALAPLDQAMGHTDVRTCEDAAAAHQAISKQNHHLFYDRDGSGRMFWVVNPEDEPER